MRSHIDTKARGSKVGRSKADGPRAAARPRPATPRKAGRDRRAASVDPGPLSNIVGYALRRAQLAVFDEAIRALGKLDLRPAQYSVLALIGHQPGLKQSEVAAALGIQRANFVVLLDRLERRGLARRSAAANDRRSYALHLTEEGKRVLHRANALVAAIEARLDARLGPGGRAQLLDLLQRLTTHA
jgi:DNA-binding MarR family transcriptional regulator